MKLIKTDLEEYLGIVVDLEKSIELQKQIIEKLQQKISILEISCNQKIPPPPAQLETISTSYWMRTVISSVISGFLLAIIISFPALLFGAELALWIVLYVLIAIIVSLARIKTKYLNRCIEERKYEQDCEIYQGQLDQENQRLRREWQRRELYQENLRKATERMHAMEQVLRDVYSLNIIYEKYRTLPYVCSLYEYIKSGCCSSLQGNGGAYNLLEQEIFRKTLILQHDLIIRQLDKIQENQYMLYCTIQDNNEKLNNLLLGIDQIANQLSHITLYQEDMRSCLDEVQKKSGISAFYAEQINKELFYMNRMNYFAGKYDDAGIFCRRPPT